MRTDPVLIADGRPLPCAAGRAGDYGGGVPEASLSIAPDPSDDEAAAIAAAVMMMWPQPAATAPEPPRSPAWRFSGRWWRRDRFASADRPWR